MAVAGNVQRQNKTQHGVAKMRVDSSLYVFSAQHDSRVGMRALEFTDITARLARWEFPAGIEGVVAIATGGVVPGALVAQRLGLELRIIALNYRDEANEPRHTEPQLLSAVPDLRPWRKILLVDDVYVSGKSWHAARALLPQAIEVLPFVMKGKVDFALIRDVDGCVQWPWKPAW